METNKFLNEINKTCALGHNPSGLIAMNAATLSVIKTDHQHIFLTEPNRFIQIQQKKVKIFTRVKICSCLLVDCFVYYLGAGAEYTVFFKVP